MKIQGLNEGKKIHEFKAYNELDKEFLKIIEETIPKSLSEIDLVICKDNLLDLFYKVISKSKLEFDEKLKYLLEIAD